VVKAFVHLNEAGARAAADASTAVGRRASLSRQSDRIGNAVRLLERGLPAFQRAVLASAAARAPASFRCTKAFTTGSLAAMVSIERSKYARDESEPARKAAVAS